MKRVSVFALLMLMLLPAFVAAQQTNQQSTVPSHSLDSKRRWNYWAGTVPMAITTSTTSNQMAPCTTSLREGFYKNGSWKQDGERSTWKQTTNSPNDRVESPAAHMEGKAWNVKGQTWTWEAERDSSHSPEKPMHAHAPQDLMIIQGTTFALAIL